MNFIMKALLRKKMKGVVPEDQQDKIISAIEKDPKFFQNLALEIQAKMKEGKDEQTATMEVMMKNKDTLGQILK